MKRTHPQRGGATRADPPPLWRTGRREEEEEEEFFNHYKNDLVILVWRFPVLGVGSNIECETFVRLSERTEARRKEGKQTPLQSGCVGWRHEGENCPTLNVCICLCASPTVMDQKRRGVGRKQVVLRHKSESKEAKGNRRQIPGL